MSDVPIAYIGKDYDYLAPLACGDVRAEGIALTLDRVGDTMAGGSAQVKFLASPDVEAGEYSFSLYLIGLSRGDRQFVGIPFFANRGFRHRCIYVRRDSGLRSGKDLEGRRVGLNAWKTTGNTWTRAVLREDGARLDRIDWLIGPMDDSGRDAAHNKPPADLPAYVRLVPPGRTLESMLLSGDLDAMLSPAPPPSYAGADGQTVRLYPNYRQIEKDYYARTGIYQAHHIVVLRRDAFERNPWVARSLYDALERSKRRWQERRRGLAETTPWMEEEIAEAIRVFGDDWQVNGVDANAKLIKTLCEEEYAQGLVNRPIDPAEVFEEFERIAREARSSLAP